MSSVQLHQGQQPKNKVQDKTEELIETAKASANAAQQKAGNASETTQAKAINAAESVHEKATNAAASAHENTGDAAADAAASAQRDEQTVQNQNQSPGILQQTGEQVAHIAQDAVNTVKSTLGIDSNK